MVYREPQSMRWKSRLPFNIVRPNVRQQVSTLGTFRPRFKVRPATSDPEDYQRANVGQKVATHYYDALEMPEKKWEILHWLELCGNAFAKVYYNPNGGEPNYVDVERPDSDADEDATGPMVDIEYEGEVESHVPSPFSIYIDPFCETATNVRWIMEVSARPREWVEQNFPERADFVPEQMPEDRLGQSRWSMQLAENSGAYGSIDSERMKNWVLVREYWEVPSVDYPRGRLIIDANGVILRSGDNPTPRGRLPYVWMRKEIVPGTVWGQTSIEDLLPIQRATNRAMNKKIEHVVLTVNAKALEHTSNALPDSSWNTENEVIKWGGVAPPSWLAPPPLGSDVDALVSDLGMFSDRVTSNFGPARGQYQGKVSGRAYLALIEQDIQTKSPVIDRLAAFFGRWATLVLECVKANVIEQRLLKIVGRGDSFDIQEFTGADLGDNTDVLVDVDSMTPKSKAMALELLASLGPGEKWLSAQNPDDRSRVWKMLGMEDEERLVEDKRRDEREARNENKLMMLGQMVEPPQSYQDLDVHMLVHNELRKSDEYKQADPIIRAMVDAHCQQTLALAMPQVGVTMPPGMGGPGMGEESGMEAPDPRMGGGGGGMMKMPQDPMKQQQKITAFS